MSIGVVVIAVVSYRNYLKQKRSSKFTFQLATLDRISLFVRECVETTSNSKVHIQLIRVKSVFMCPLPDTVAVGSDASFLISEDPHE